MSISQCHYIYPRGEQRGLHCTNLVTDGAGSFCPSCRLRSDVRLIFPPSPPSSSILDDNLFKISRSFSVPKESLDVHKIGPALFLDLRYNLLITIVDSVSTCIGFIDPLSGEKRNVTQHERDICHRLNINIA